MLEQLVDQTTKVKMAIVDLSTIASFLLLDGTKKVTVEGWPHGGVILSSRVEKFKRARDGHQFESLVMIVYHPDFPVNLAMEPPVLDITISVEPIEEDTSDG